MRAPSPRPPVVRSPRLGRKEFYDLTVYCRQYALELARFDQDKVNLKECNRFNEWLRSLRRYEELVPTLANLRPARPIARWQIMVLLFVGWAILALTLPGRVGNQLYLVLTGGVLLTVLAVFFLPESLYGTTIELLDGKVLYVVDALLAILNSGKMEFSEAVFFRARENLLIARNELRQQIDLAHRPVQ
jgi:hypothetical protein